jgi:hypothetical protein
MGSGTAPKGSDPDGSRAEMTKEHDTSIVAANLRRSI